MRRLLTWYANRRRPDVAEDFGYAWRLLPRVHLVVVAYSDDEDDNRPLEGHQAWVVLSGRVLVNGRGWQRAGIGLKGRPQRFTLPEARTYEESLLDLHGWMGGEDILHDTGHQAWLLTIS